MLIDLYSRAIVGWALSTTLHRELCVEALESALAQRKPPRGLLHHSDQGSQYASTEYRALLQRHDITCSMSRRGNCWDNAVAESFFATLKKELVLDADFATRDAARLEVFRYVEGYYNHHRLHSSLGYLTPAEADDLAVAARLAA